MNPFPLIIVYILKNNVSQQDVGKPFCHEYQMVLPRKYFIPVMFTDDALKGTNTNYIIGLFLINQKKNLFQLNTLCNHSI